MTSARKAARRKWTILALFWVLQAAVLYVLLAGWLTTIEVVWDSGKGSWSAFSIADWGECLRASGYAQFMLIALPVFTLLQAFFLLPVSRPAPARQRGWPIWLSLAVAGLAASGLLFGLLAIVLELFHVSDKTWEPITRHVHSEYILLAIIFSCWLIATPLLIVFCRRGRRETLLARVAAWLFLGTIIEAAASIPVDVMVRKRTYCYCGAGTFWTLTICLSVGALVAGPAIFLPILAWRRKRWYAGRCDVCGYDMTGLPDADRCPECGSGWRAAARPAAPR